MSLFDPEDHFDLCQKRRAILGGTGHMLILGGPGSGKTTIGLLKARRTVLERLQPEQSVLFLSFSNSAIRRILEAARIVLRADVSRHVEIRTYHSFAWDILRSHGYLLSMRRCLRIIAAQDAAVMRAGLVDDVCAAQEERLFLADGRLTYDQFAPQAAALLERSTVVRELFSYAHPVIIVDEFQDTDNSQWRFIRTLSQDSEIIALGDTEQRIYAWRKGVSSTRLESFIDELRPAVFDFENENNRSPDTGIVSYARSLLSPQIRRNLPDDIEIRRFRPGQFAVGLHFALIATWKSTIRRTGRRHLSVVVAARSRMMVRLISDALTQRVIVRGRILRPVRHDVMFDQMQIALAARLVAFVMGSHADQPHERLSGALERISAVYRSSGTKTGIQTSDRLSRWADRCRHQEVPNTKCVRALTSVFSTIYPDFVGSPRDDWLTVRRALETADADELRRTGDHARYLRLLRRGSAIEERLTDLWKQSGDYSGAERALDDAIIQDQLTDNHRESGRISVMTMHQLKAREYDAVLLVEDRHRTFRGRDDRPPFMETRRLLQVSLTRARHFACVLSDTKNATMDVIFG